MPRPVSCTRIRNLPAADVSHSTRTLPPVAIVLDSVGDEVQQHLLEPLAIGAHICVVDARRVHRELDAARRGEGTDQVDDLAHHLADAHRLGRHVQAARLDARDVQHFVDQGEQVSAGFQNLVATLLHARRRRIQLDQLAEPEDRVQRRPQLVAHPREKFALGAARGFGRFARRAQHIFGAAAFGDVADRRPPCR